MFSYGNTMPYLFVKPRFGVSLYNGVWPPMNARCGPPPARDFWPFCPLPALFPIPEPIPRPLRFRNLLFPGLLTRSVSSVRGAFAKWRFKARVEEPSCFSGVLSRDMQPKTASWS
jgi:hypothetical protein